MAINFVREVIEKSPIDSPDVAKREQAMMVYLFLQSVSLELQGKQNAVGTVISNTIANAEVSRTQFVRAERTSRAVTLSVWLDMPPVSLSLYMMSGRTS